MPKTLRVGTYDSRAIAAASAQPVFAPSVKDLKEKYAKAKAENNKKLMEELQAEGEAQQQLMHQQGFSVTPVKTILEKFTGELPKVAKEAGVDLIMSEWEVIYKSPEVETVDITMPLVMLFNPDESTLKMIKEIRKQPPMPLVELLKRERLQAKAK